ncbi:MAG: Ig-like domain-containing protein, partial [FCB group bacterium]|nr:Ig-like domain-containing protein [FCB group bacterium]
MLARVSGGTRRWRLGLMLAALLWASVAEAELSVAVTGPSGNFKQSLPEEGGAFDVSIPLNKNSVNNVKVTASDAKGNSAEKEIAITQVSLESVVISEFTSTPIPPERIEQLVNSGVIQLDNPENYNVSQFSVVLTIGTRQVPISIPIATPINQEITGYETYKLPWGRDSGGGNPNPQIEIVVFEEQPPSSPGLPEPPKIPGVIIIEGRIKSLKEFFSCRLLLMNASGIFTLSDVSASLSFPDGGLSNVLPADGIASFGDILPGDGGKPGQIEKEFIIRGDSIGVRKVRVNFGGTVTGPGIPADQAIPFNGSAVTDVEVKGPPTFLVQLTHPDYVTSNEPYELKVDITNTGETPALYASLDLDVGADAELMEAKGDPATGEVTYVAVTGTVTRSLGHIFPGQSTSQTYRIVPYKTGPITSCMGIADQNITLQVIAGIGGCVTGTYPPTRGVPDGVPTVAVLPPANATGIGIDAPVVALFSEKMSEPSITTGESGTFNVTDSDGNRVPGQLRFEEISGRMAAIWQVNDGVTNRLKPDAEYTVFISGARDLQGQDLYSPWQSTFSTTGMALNDHTPPDLTLMILPPVRADYVMPGQVVKVNAYGTDQGSGVVRVECRIKDLDDPEGKYTLVDMKA